MTLEPFQGVWNIVSLEMDGEAVRFDGAGISVVGNRFVTSGMGAQFEGELVVDESVLPARLDLNFAAGPHAGMASLAIYEIDGDTWKLCLCLAGGARPTEFRTTPGSGQALEVLRRSSAVAEYNRESALETEALAGSSAIDEGHEDPEIERLTGTWSALAIIRSGEPLPAEFAAYGRRIATRDEITVKFGPQVFVHANYRIDSSTSPKSIDYILLDGQSNGQVQLGIYELEGDLLRTLMSGVGDPRPVTFETKPGDGRTLAEWNRSK